MTPALAVFVALFRKGWTAFLFFLVSIAYATLEENEKKKKPTQTTQTNKHRQACTNWLREEKKGLNFSRHESCTERLAQQPLAVVQVFRPKGRNIR